MKTETREIAHRVSLGETGARMKAMNERSIWPVVVVGLALALISVSPLADAETFVLPVVARGVPGINGSVWDSEVRVFGPGQFVPGSIRRLWVALPDGGSLDDPATAPHWTFPEIICPGLCLPGGVVVLTGSQLLRDTDASKGAVALEIEGTGNHVFLHNSNTLGQARLPQDTQGPACCLPGNGQLIRGLTEPLTGGAFIPWITSGRSPYRVSVGLINPTAQARSIIVQFDVKGAVPAPPASVPDGTFWLTTFSATLTVDLAPWGFRQLDSLAALMLEQCPSCEALDRVAPAEILLLDTDQSGLPFYAYASVIWTPLNDPEFIVAEPLGP